MMNLDANNGTLQLGKWIFTPNDRLNDIKVNFSSREFELRLANDQWTTYRLNIFNEYIIRIVFFDEQIKFVEIYPKNIGKNTEEKALFDILKKLGGENRYFWGNVELNIDNKADYISILINYH